ncbi:hypothetical protein ONZ51_g236 [Trametes cubensis]|uniref:Transmembrane protein n=1 Tax=Trametes cubensis TaxID=1111947 RepID=A0AAD7U684_9APHY|nr:hypothetical protein ONZ51_g236 [Trametes cubensis]
MATPAHRTFLDCICRCLTERKARHDYSSRDLMARLNPVADSRPTKALFTTVGVVLSCFSVRSMCATPAQFPGNTSCADNSWAWTYNSIGQSPCDVGLTLISLCGSPAQAVTNSSCYCNTVTYSLWAACEACHQATWSPFQQYLGLLPCSGEVDVGFYKLQIPAGTLVPHWAYLFRPQETNQSATFDVQLTKQEGCSQSQCPTTTPAATTTSTSSSTTNTGPTSTPHEIWSSSTQHAATSARPPATPGTSTDTGTTGTSLSVSFSTGGQPTSSGSLTVASTGSQQNTTASNTQTTAPSGTGTSSSPDSPSDVAAPNSERKTSKATVIGAAVGATGAAIVGVAALVLVLVRRRRRRRTVPALVPNLSSTENKPPESGSQHCETDLDGSVDSVPAPATVTQAVLPSVRPRLYDPDDPTTFPPSLSDIMGDERRAVLDSVPWTEQRGPLPEAPELRPLGLTSSPKDRRLLQEAARMTAPDGQRYDDYTRFSKEKMLHQTEKHRDDQHHYGPSDSAVEVPQSVRGFPFAGAALATHIGGPRRTSGQDCEYCHGTFHIISPALNAGQDRLPSADVEGIRYNSKTGTGQRVASGPPFLWRCALTEAFMGGRLETARLLRKSTSLVQIFLLSGFIACDVNAGAVIWPPTIACADNSWSWDNLLAKPDRISYSLVAGPPKQVRAYHFYHNEQDEMRANLSANNAPCYCNTVVYSLWAACVYCHGEGYSTFADYLSGGNCLDVSYGSYSCQIPSDTSVPPWAYQFNPSHEAALACIPAPQAGPTKSASHPTLPNSSSSSSLSSGTTSRVPGSSSAPDGTSSSVPSQVTPSPSTTLPGNSSAGTSTPFNQSTSTAASTSSPIPESQIEPSQSSSQPTDTALSHPNMGQSRAPGAAIIGAAVGAGVAVRRGDPSAREPRASKFEHSESEFDTTVDQAHSPVSTGQSTLSKTIPSYYTVKLYDPDDPTTFPPSLSEILGSERPVSAPGDWHDSQTRSHESRDSERYKVF